MWRIFLRYGRLAGMAVVAVCGLSSPVSAQHRLCDSGAEDCRQILIDHIRAETERLDVAFWFMEDSWMASEIIARWNAGVPVRILMDSEASIRNGRNRERLAEFQAAGVPMRERTTSGIMHWKMMLFAGQGLVEFGGANYSADAWLPSGAPYTNYLDEGILFTTKPSVVNSFKTKFDELWIDSVNYRDYAYVAGPQSRVWTARALAPWITVTPAAGDAVLSIGVQHVAGMATSGELQGGVEIAVTGAANTPGPVAVTLDVRPTGTTSAPFGGLETPAEGAANVTGAIAVTGWALDDVGVSAVRVYRNCVGHDPAGACQGVLGEELVFVGDGVFVDGARPDVEAAFPDAPNARAAGWGLMVLTNMLPHLPERRGSCGQGEVTLYAVATDADRHQSLLGRRTISLDNDHASKPFGAIDTPANGAVASGVVANFGWALTPGTARIPLDGSTIRIYIDGRPVSGVHCRLAVPSIAASSRGRPAPVSSGPMS